MITTEQLDNFIFDGKKLREASRGLYEDMNYLPHGLVSERVEEDVFVYRLERDKTNKITVQKILGWVNGESVKFEGEPVEDAEFKRNSEGRPYFVSDKKIFTRVVR